jgi:ankyrin repeat protein
MCSLQAMDNEISVSSAPLSIMDLPMEIITKHIGPFCGLATLNHFFNICKTIKAMCNTIQITTSSLKISGIDAIIHNNPTLCTTVAKTVHLKYLQHYAQDPNKQILLELFLDNMSQSQSKNYQEIVHYFKSEYVPKIKMCNGKTIQSIKDVIVSVNACSGDEVSELLLDACRGFYQIDVQIISVLLLCNQLNVNGKDEYGDTALHTAARRGKVNVLKALLTHNQLKIDATNNRGLTALHVAAYGDCVDIVKALLADSRLNLNATDKDGEIALNIAARLGNVDMVKALLANSQLNVNAKDKGGTTALHAAAYRGKVDVVKTLLADSRLDVNAKDKWGDTALHTAAYRGKVDLVKILLADSRLDVNAKKDECGDTALHTAAYRGKVDVVNTLLTHNKLKIGATDSNGRTALHLAAYRSEVDVVNALLSKNALEGFTKKFPSNATADQMTDELYYHSRWIIITYIKMILPQLRPYNNPYNNYKNHVKFVYTMICVALAVRLWLIQGP